MRSSALFASFGALLSTAGVNAQYVLSSDFHMDNFFDEFEFFTEPDPTEGFVKYVDQQTAMDNGYAGSSNGAVYLGVDFASKAVDGRNSVRLQSRKTFTKGLFVADIAHMPSSTCGLWPAFWMFGPNWPTGGEIDIIEGVHNSQANSVTLHTSPSCQVSNHGAMASTKFVDSNCHSTTGCGQATSGNQNYGDGFNDNNGGVYAMDWTDSFMAVWYFPRHRIPQDIQNGTPDPNPDNWGPPLARFSSAGSCDLNNHFKDNQIVFNIDFCGDWAGKVWDLNPECSALASTCDQYVANNPEAFSNAFWLINSLKVYEQSQPGQTPTPSPFPQPQQTELPPQANNQEQPSAQPSAQPPAQPASQPQQPNNNGLQFGDWTSPPAQPAREPEQPASPPPPPAAPAAPAPAPAPPANGQSVTEGEDGSLQIGI